MEKTLSNIMIYIFIMLCNILDIFMITYFGNEMKLSSGRFLYCLFESDWIDQPQSYKKCLIIFGERLKRAHAVSHFSFSDFKIGLQPVQYFKIC